MWIPKTEEELKELAKEREKGARILGVTGTLFIILIIVIDAKYFGIKIEKSPIPLTQPIYTWSQILKSLPRISIFASIFGLLVYFGVRKFRQISSLICDKCGKIKRYDKVENCDCGGQFIFLEEMNWIEDEKPENNNEETKANT
jgi:hypothetical protein